MTNSVEFQNRINELIVFDEKEKVKTCKQIGVDARAISLAKDFGIIPATQSLIKIADYFNISIEFLLGYTEDDSFTPAQKPSNFADRLRTLIEKDGNTPYKLALKWHVDKSYLTRWLQGKFVANISSLEIIADYFDVSIDYLLGRTDYK